MLYLLHPCSRTKRFLTTRCSILWIERLGKAEAFAFDTETTSLDAIQAQIVGVSFTDRVGHGAYVPLAHNYPDAPAQLIRDAVLKNSSRCSRPTSRARSART